MGLQDAINLFFHLDNLGVTTEKGENHTLMKRRGKNLTKEGKIEPLSQPISIFVIPRLGTY